MSDKCKFKERCSCLTISGIVPVMESGHLLRLRNKGYSDALGSFFEWRKSPFYCLFARFVLSSSHFDREETSSLMHFPEF